VPHIVEAVIEVVVAEGVGVEAHQVERVDRRLVIIEGDKGGVPPKLSPADSTSVFGLPARSCSK